MGIKSYLIFDDIDSRDYGIEVFFKDVDRTPKRVYTKVEVAGRNGSVLIDEGRYEDVPVAYDCIALKDADRKAFVNALSSKAGYYKLQDSFNSDEFYSAVFDGDVDPNLTTDRKKSVFTINFTRYPQRWLVEGKTPITVSDGDVVSNSTSYDAYPLLAVEGYGAIGFNGYEITIDNATLGRVSLSNDVTHTSSGTSGQATISLNMSTMESGDSFTMNLERQDTFSFAPVVVAPAGAISIALDRETMAGSTNYAILNSGNSVLVNQSSPQAHEFVYGTSKTITLESYLTVTYTMSYPVVPQTTQVGIGTTITYDGDHTITLTFVTNYDYSNFPDYPQRAGHILTATAASIIGVSTQPMLGHPTYIDCDLGEAYKYEGDSLISLNKYIALGSDLPRLASGDNTITADATITDIQMTPRWWML